MSDFTSITDIQIKFLLHHQDPKAHVLLNNNYGESIFNHARMCTDSAAQDTVRPDSELLPLIRTIIVDELITPFATETPDNASVSPVIQGAAMWVEIGTLQRRLSRNSLTLALQHAVAKGAEHIEIKIGTSHMCFDNSTGPLNFLDWTKITTTAPVAPPPPTPPAVVAATDIAAAAASAMPPPVAAADLATAFATACPATAPATGPTTAAVSGPTMSSTATAMWTFNPATLPADVRNRYDNKVSGGPILGSTTSTRHAGGNMHHVDTNKTILSDGTVWLHQPPNEKGLMKAAVCCEDDAHAGTHAWYSNFVQSCHDHGFHAHPLWAFRRDHGGERGFTVGNDPDDDLPQRMAIPLQQMSHPIFRILSKKEMFPKNSRLAGIARSSDGDGYRALKAVIFKSHPAFHDQPSALIATYPKQREGAVLEHCKLFKDYQQLRAHVANISATLDDATELDMFIKNSKHSTCLNRVTRDERRLASLAHKCRGSQLVETIDKFLMAPDSPALLHKPRTNPNKCQGNQFRKTKPHSIPVQQLSTFAEYEEDATTDEEPELEEAPSPDILTELHAIQVPKDHRNRELHHLCSAATHRIGAQPKTAESRPCIVCGEDHRFENCAALNNTEFLRNHCIRHCQHLRRDATAKELAFPGTKMKAKAPRKPPTNKPKKTQMHFVDAEDMVEDTNSDSDDSQDFQRGRD